MKPNIKYNKAQNGIEISFSARPADSVISDIKSMGFRWSMRNKVWYKTYSEYLWKKVNEKFENADATPAPAPQIEKPKVVVPKITNQYRVIASLKWSEFNANPDDVIENYKYGIRLTWNNSKQEYQHTQKHRKTPDKYPTYVVHDEIMQSVLEAGEIVDFDIYYSNPMINRSGYAMNYDAFQKVIKNHPQQLNAPNYEKWNKLFFEAKQKSDADAEYWLNWKKTYLSKNQDVYVYITGNKKWEKWSIEDPEQKESAYLGNREDVIKLFKKGGYITYYTPYLLEKVYYSNPEIDKNAKNLIDYYGKEIKEPAEKRLTKSDIPANVLKFTPPQQIEAIIGSREHFDIVSELSKQIDEIPTNCNLVAKKIEKQFPNLHYHNYYVVHAHIFYAGTDIYVLEWDRNDLLFTYTILNGDVQMSELGNASLSEIHDIGKFELDFFWTKQLLSEVLYSVDDDYFKNPQLSIKDLQENNVSDDAEKAKRIRIAKVKAIAKLKLLNLIKL